MSIEHFDLPDGQSAEIQRRPSHGQMKEIERLTRKAIADDLALQVEDALVLTLVTEWNVHDNEGNPLPLKRESLDRVPQDTMSLLTDELQGVTSATRPNDAIAGVITTLRGLKQRLSKPAERAAMDDVIKRFREVMGVPVPNDQDQTAS